MEVILGIIIFIIIIKVVNSVFNSSNSSRPSTTIHHQTELEPASYNLPPSKFSYSVVEEPRPIKNLYQGHSISEDGDRVFFYRTNGLGDAEMIEIINCWIESVLLENDGDFINLQVLHRGEIYKMVGIPVDESYEIISKLGNYFQNKVIWEFKKLKKLYIDYLNENLNQVNRNISSNMEEILNQTLKRQYGKMLRIFKEYKVLVGVYIEDDLSVSVSDIEMNLEVIDKVFLRNNSVS